MNNKEKIFVKKMYNMIKEEIKIDDILKITDIFVNFEKTTETRGIQLKTKNENYIEIYDDGTWEYFKKEE